MTNMDSQATNIQSRVPLSKVEIDTPALLNMIKHCQENGTNEARGHIMGVLKQKINNRELFITETLPDTSILPNQPI